MVDSQTGNSLKRNHPRSPDSQHSSGSSSANDAGAVTRNTNQKNGAATQLPSPVQTPSKRVRFSDPGLPLGAKSRIPSTGLTPALKRSSVSGRQQNVGARTPSRRQSGPLSVTLSDSLGGTVSTGRPAPVNVRSASSSEIMDGRTRRRLWRSRLSDERHKLEDEKRDLRRARAQIESLSRELEAYRSASGSNGPETSDENYGMIPIEEDTMDGSILMSDSPTFQRYHDAQGSGSDHSASPDSSSPITPMVPSNVTVSIMDDQPSEELQSLTAHLDAARREKRDLFNEWRKLRNNPSSTEAETEDVDPPADFMRQIVPRLEAAIRKESDLNQALKTVQDELTDMGFSGPNIDVILSQMRDVFQSARMELETLLPGETPSARSDGKATIEALVRRLRQTSGALLNERQRAESLSANHDAIKRQFDLTLERLEREREKRKNMKESADRNAEDTLHLRTCMQELEEKLNHEKKSIDRYKQRLKEHEKDAENYERLIGELEQKKCDNERAWNQQKAALEEALATTTNTAAERLGTIEELNQTLTGKKDEIDRLIARVDELAADNKQMRDAMRERDQELGRLNARLAQESTELRTLKDDLAKAEELNNMLEAHNQQEVNARNRIENWFSNSLNELKKMFDVERENERQRQIMKDTLLGKFSNQAEGSEPSLPTNSPFRTSQNGALENVRLGRGRDRRTLFSSDMLRLDSGIGSSDHAGPQTDVPAGSDAFLIAVGDEFAEGELADKQLADNEEHLDDEEQNIE